MLLMLARLMEVGAVRFRCACLPLLVLERCAQTGRISVGLLEVLKVLDLMVVCIRFLLAGHYVLLGVIRVV